jgi:uncharacterized protein
MRRNLLDKLITWKDSKHRHPLILKGARQVGKTYLLKEFGKTYFTQVHYFNFEEDPNLSLAFSGELNVDSLLNALLLSRASLRQSPQLIFFDEIQACPRALTALKYFAEQASELYVCAAGSLLGVTLIEESFPVGKVDYLYLTPLKFSEYLLANEPPLYTALQSAFEKPLNERLHQQLINRFQFFAALGGLPRASLIAADLSHSDLELSDALAKFHDDIIRTYQSDFAKHAGDLNAVHINSTFTAIPSQLGSQVDGSTKRFRFNQVGPRLKKFSQLEGPIQWLSQAGLSYKVKLLSRIQFPLESFSHEHLFKLYLFDTGILLRMLRVPFAVAIQNNYGLHKGFVMENVILNQMIEDEVNVPYFWQGERAEVDFVTVFNNQIVPIEVKSGHKTASKSLHSAIQQYKPKISLRLSCQNFFKEKKYNILNVPLYMSENLDHYLLDPE